MEACLPCHRSDYLPYSGCVELAAKRVAELEPVAGLQLSRVIQSLHCESVQLRLELATLFVSLPFLEYCMALIPKVEKVRVDDRDFLSCSYVFGRCERGLNDVILPFGVILRGQGVEKVAEKVPVGQAGFAGIFSRTGMEGEAVGDDGMVTTKRECRGVPRAPWKSQGPCEVRNGVTLDTIALTCGCREVVAKGEADILGAAAEETA